MHKHGLAALPYKIKKVRKFTLIHENLHQQKFPALQYKNSATTVVQTGKNYFHIGIMEINLRICTHLNTEAQLEVLVLDSTRNRDWSWLGYKALTFMCDLCTCPTINPLVDMMMN